MEPNLFKFKSLLTKIKLTRKNVLLSPTEPGIYIFWKKENTPQYVGKSVSLKNRLISYLSLPLELKTKEMVRSSDSFSFIRVNSELEALLLEAKLIKLFKPKYNIQLKDDKNPLFIKITNDEFPQVVTARKMDVLRKSTIYYGPFPSSTVVKKVLKMVRKIIPFAQHKPQKRVCLYSQLGLCNPCPSMILATKDPNERKNLKRVYLKNIHIVKTILDGKISKVSLGLNALMKEYSKKRDFEKAATVRDQIKNLEYVSQSISKPSDFIDNPNLLVDIRDKETKQLEFIIKSFFDIGKIVRIECYDIAHLTGTKPTASMVTFINGESNKNLYRRFRIDPLRGGNDIASLEEVAKRRFRHLDSWGRPDLILIDGGKGQVNVFRKLFERENIPIVGIAKRYETLVIPMKGAFGEKFKLIRLKRGPLLSLVQRLRNEAHRFARSYHHKLIQKELLS